MASRSLLMFVLCLCASLLSFATCAAGLHFRLTHVDAKENCTIQEMVRRATERTRRRLASMGDVTAPVHWNGTRTVNGGQYIAEYLIGNPPQQAEAIIDTGSNLIWTQCSVCQPNCFSQNLSYYDPSLSSTAHGVACGDAACHLGDETGCASDGKTCAVNTSYGAGNIVGELGTETFTFQSSEVSLVFGCISETKLIPGSPLDGASGLIGLGRGLLSLVSQLNATKFSYCLTRYFSDAANTTSHLFVGESASLSGNANVTSVPFVQNPDVSPYNTFYYLPLAGITVGETNLDVPAGTFDLVQVAPGQWTGTLIDSGSPFTTLAGVAYQALRAELVRQLGTSLVQPPAGNDFDLCMALADADKLVPPLTLQFGNGSVVDVAVPPANYWLAVDDTTACMVVFSSADPNGTLASNETTMIGNFMTQNAHLLYDLGEGVLSLQEADCSSM